MERYGYMSLGGEEEVQRQESARKEQVEKVIREEIKSIQKDRKKPQPEYVRKEKKTTNEYMDEIEAYLDKKKLHGFRTINDLSNGTDSYFRNRQVQNEEVLQELLRDNDMTKLQVYTSSRNYHNDRFDKIKIIKYFEDNVHKYRRKIERSMRDDLTTIKDYLHETVKNMMAVTSSIYTEYLNIMQRRMTLEYMKVINEEQYNVYDTDTQQLLERIARRESSEYLKYKIFFLDYIKLIDFSNKNVLMKKKFVQEHFKFNTFNEEVKISTYVELLNKNVEDLVQFNNDMLLQYKQREVDKATESKYINALRVKDPKLLPGSEFVADVGAGGGDDKVLFEMGDTTKVAEPYWKINQLLVHRSVETSHSSKETIKDMMLVDKERYAITCSTDNSVRITNMITGENRLAIPLVTKEGVECMCMDKARNRLVVGGRGGEIVVYDLVIGEKKGVMIGHRDVVWMMLEVGGEGLISCSEDHSVKFWNMELMTCYKTLISSEARGVRCVVRYGDSRIIYSSKKMFMYNINKDDIEKVFSGHTDYVTSMCIDVKYNRLISSAADHTIRFWSIDTCTLLKVISTDAARCMNIWSNEYLLTSHDSFHIKFWDLALTRLLCVKNTKIFVNKLHVANDGKIIYPEYNSLVILKNPSI